MSGATHTPGPWDYVQSTEYHGPYVTSDYGSTICDCYTMSNTADLSVRNGGESRPIHHLHEMADPNARLIAAAPDMLAALEMCINQLERDTVALYDDFLAVAEISNALAIAHAAIAKARGEAE